MQYVDDAIFGIHFVCMGVIWIHITYTLVFLVL